jgi:hypothetical protein
MTDEPTLTVETDAGEMVVLTESQARAVAQDLATSQDPQTQAFRDMLLRWLRGEQP